MEQEKTKKRGRGAIAEYDGSQKSGIVCLELRGMEIRYVKKFAVDRNKPKAHWIRKAIRTYGMICNGSLIVCREGPDKSLIRVDSDIMEDEHALPEERS